MDAAGSGYAKSSPQTITTNFSGITLTFCLVPKNWDIQALESSFDL